MLVLHESSNRRVATSQLVTSHHTQHSTVRACRRPSSVVIVKFVQSVRLCQHSAERRSGSYNGGNCFSSASCPSEVSQVRSELVVLDSCVQFNIFPPQCVVPVWQPLWSGHLSLLLCTVSVIGAVIFRCRDSKRVELLYVETEILSVKVLLHLCSSCSIMAFIILVYYLNVMKSPVWNDIP